MQPQLAEEKARFAKARQCEDSDEKARATLKNTDLLQKFREIEAMPDNEQHSIITVINAYIRDFKTRQAYAS